MTPAPSERDRKLERKWASFEGLRGVLALTVCVGHLGLNTIAAQFGVHVRFELAVDVFFAISGFVLARAYYFKRRSFWRLFTGRIARLYPLHLVTLVWCVALYVLAEKTLDPSLVLQNLFLIQNIGLPPNSWAFNFPSWSISVEFVVSLLFYFILTRDLVALLPLLLSLGIGLAAFAACAPLGDAGNFIGFVNYGLLRGVSGFSIGCASYLFSLRHQQGFLRSWVSPLFFCVALFFLLPSWSWLAGASFAGCTFLALAVSASNDDATILSLPIFVFLGSISYSVYLLHIPILLSGVALLTEDGVRGLVAKLTMLTLIVVASVACYRFFELPMQRRFLRWFSDSGELRER